VRAFIDAGGNPALAVMEFNSIRTRFFEQLKAEVSLLGLLVYGPVAAVFQLPGR